MFSLPEMSSTTSKIFSAYASFSASAMLVRSMTNELVPQQVRSYIYSKIQFLFTPKSSNLTLYIEEFCGFLINQVYESAQIYLASKINPSTQRLKITKLPRQKHFVVSIDKGEEIVDFFDEIELKWRFICSDSEKPNAGEKRFFELTFDKKFKQKVLDFYLPHVLASAKALKEKDKVVKLYTRDSPFSSSNEDEDQNGGVWGSINLEHPATFETLAMDPELKKSIIEDLERFLRRKEFYKKVGKAWKRGYLLYGPPGTGKSSLIAAMANYLKFDVYDLELSSIFSNSELRRVLLSTTNRSILVIEDIDCNSETLDREKRVDLEPSYSRLTLSGILNFIDGLWSSCGDERIIVFTTNHKDRLDPALLRPGRMDVHIHMSYCTPSGFRLLASNYLDIHDKHHLFKGIEDLMVDAQVTPAQVAEELMKSEDADVALGGLVEFLKQKRVDDEATNVETRKPKRVKIENIRKKLPARNHRRVVGRGRSYGRSGGF